MEVDAAGKRNVRHAARRPLTQLDAEPLVSLSRTTDGVLAAPRCTATGRLWKNGGRKPLRLNKRYAQTVWPTTWGWRIASASFSDARAASPNEKCSAACVSWSMGTCAAAS